MWLREQQGDQHGRAIGARRVSVLLNESAKSAAIEPKMAITESSSGPRFRRNWKTVTPNRTKMRAAVRW